MLLTMNISLSNAYNISLSYQVHQLQVQVSDLQRRADKVCILCISLHRVNTRLNNEELGTWMIVAVVVCILPVLLNLYLA